MTKKFIIHYCSGTGGNVTDDVCKFINEYQQLNKKLYLNLKATS